MKKLLVLLISICFSQISFSQNVPLDSVANYEGKTITVCSKVQSTYVTKGEKKTTTRYKRYSFKFNTPR